MLSRRARCQARLGTARGRWCVYVWQRTNGVRSLSIVGRGARGRFCGTAERMGCMGMPLLAERHFRTSLMCLVRAGRCGHGYPGIAKPPLQRLPIPVYRWGVVKR